MFKWRDELMTGCVLAGIIGVVTGTIVNWNQLEVIETRNEFIVEQLVQVTRIAEGLGELNQGVNSILIRMNHFDERVRELGEKQAALGQRYLDDNQMYAVKGSQVDSNQQQIADLWRRMREGG